MISIRNNADMTQVLATPLDPVLRALLIERRDQLLIDVPDTDLGEVVHIIVADADDAIATIEGGGRGSTRHQSDRRHPA